MATRPLSYTDIMVSAAEGGYTGIAALSNPSAAIILSWLYYLHNSRNWEVDGLPPTVAQWDVIDDLVSSAEGEIMEGAVAMIMPFAGAVIPSYALLCDGANYLRTDYPELYAALEPVFIIDADNFTVPDLRQRVVSGADGAVPVGTVGGSASETLNVNQIPSHTHTYTAPVTYIELIEPGVPLPMGTTPALGTLTGATGGGQSHNNLPPFQALNYIIISGR